MSDYNLREAELLALRMQQRSDQSWELLTTHFDHYADLLFEPLYGLRDLGSCDQIAEKLRAFNDLELVKLAELAAITLKELALRDLRKRNHEAREAS